MGDVPEVVKERRAAALKERVYVTFSALSVVLTLRAHHAHVGEASFVLLVAVLGTVLAVFLADLIAHVVVHEGLPGRAETGQLAQTTLGASTVIAVPLVFLGLAALDVLSVDTALLCAAYGLVLTLVGIGLLAIRRLRLDLVQKVVVLGAEVVIGLVVLALLVLAKL